MHGLLGGHAGGRSDLRHRLDGRHLYRGQHGRADRLDRSGGDQHALAVWARPLRHVDPAVQPGGYDPGPAPVGHRPGHLALYADRPLPRG